MSTIANKDVIIAYESRGAGTPIVLLMGLGLPGMVWHDLAERLVEEGFRVIIPDNRGTGHSDVPSPPYSMREMADDVALILDAEDVGKAIVCGVSFGGMLAQHVALNHPDRVCGLLLAATTCGVPTGRFPTLHAIYLLLKMVFASTTVTLDEAQRLFAHPESRERLPALFERWRLILDELPTPPRAIIGQLLAAAVHRTGRELHRIKVPAFVVTGDSDFLIRPENSEILARLLPRGTLCVIPKSGHIFIHEHPDSLLDCIKSLREAIGLRGGDRNPCK
ncbi:MAG: alpha/beta fold hydrolase [Bradymonadaceae bacterium]